MEDEINPEVLELFEKESYSAPELAARIVSLALELSSHRLQDWSVAQNVFWKTNPSPVLQRFASEYLQYQSRSKEENEAILVKLFQATNDNKGVDFLQSPAAENFLGLDEQVQQEYFHTFAQVPDYELDEELNERAKETYLKVFRNMRIDALYHAFTARSSVSSLNNLPGVLRGLESGDIESESIEDAYHTLAKDIIAANAFHTYAHAKIRRTMDLLREEDEELMRKLEGEFEVLEQIVQRDLVRPTSRFVPLQRDITYTSGLVQEVRDIVACNLAAYLNEQSSDIQGDLFSDEDYRSLQALVGDARLLKELGRITQEADTVHKYVQGELAAAKKIGLATIATGRVDHNSPYYEHAHNVNQAVLEYEGSRIPHPEEFIFFPGMLFNVVDPSEVVDQEFWSDKFELESFRLKLDEDRQLRVLQAIKKRASEKEGMSGLVKTLQEMERSVLEHIVFDRERLHNLSIHAFRRGELETEYLLQLRSGTNFYDSGFFGNIFDGFKDCLTENGSFETQGVSLVNNPHSTALTLSFRENSFTDRFAYKGSINNIPNPGKALGRIFVYDAHIDGQQGLFVAGFAGNEHLYQVPDWQEHALSFLEDFAVQNGYEELFFNINPLGDIRDQNNRFSHEFAKAAAERSGIGSDEFTYTKIGSGRKPRVFQLHPEAKRGYVRKVQCTREDGLKGDFFVEGMFASAREAAESEVLIDPQKKEFTPYIFEQEGYVPVVEYRLAQSNR